MNDVQRDELLIEMRTMVRAIDKALNGNGGGPSEGLISRVAVIEASIVALDRQVPSTAERRGGWAAIISAVLLGLAAVISAVVQGG